MPSSFLVYFAYIHRFLVYGLQHHSSTSQMKPNMSLINKFYKFGRGNYPSIVLAATHYSQEHPSSNFNNYPIYYALSEIFYKWHYYIPDLTTTIVLDPLRTMMDGPPISKYRLELELMTFYNYIYDYQFSHAQMLGQVRSTHHLQYLDQL